MLAEISKIKERFEGRDLLSIRDLAREEIEILFQVAYFLKEAKRKGEKHHLLPGRKLAMIFEKPSTRTRVSFEVGMYELGGYPLFLSRQELQLGRGETIGDTARTLERYVDGIVARVFHQETLEELAKSARIPVLNALSDREHPCQALGDFFTIWERDLLSSSLRFAFIGDGNNVCASLALLSAKLGIHFIHSCPVGYELPAEIWKVASEESSATGAKLEVVHSPEEGAKDADVIYTDVWVSMGQEEETERRKKDFQRFQVNSSLLKLAREKVVVMHCLPARRGEELTDEVIDGEHSIVFDQAENRLHIQKAILALFIP